MRPSIRIILAALALALPSIPVSAADVWLITQDEAARPAAPPRPRLAMRNSGAAGPQIILVRPHPGDELRSPLAVTIRFEPRGDAAVDPASLKVVVQKLFDIDITDRVRPYASAEGIAMDQAKIPAGEHVVEISVADDHGRRTSEIVKLTVVGP